MEGFWKQLFKEALFSTLGMRSKCSLWLRVQQLFKFALFSGIALLLIWFLGGKVQFVEEFNWLIASVLAVISGLLLLFFYQFFIGTPIAMLKKVTKDNEELNNKNRIFREIILRVQDNSVALVYSDKYEKCMVLTKGEYGQRCHSVLPWQRR
ncbi:hypothetical protein ACFLV5_05840 [Chloroflexota bacterium]